MTCQRELLAAGKPYPRTCSICGLGPCSRNRAKGVKNAPEVGLIALWMIVQGYATGHGDTLSDLLGELVHQVHANALLEAHNLTQGMPKPQSPIGEADIKLATDWYTWGFQSGFDAARGGRDKPISDASYGAQIPSSVPSAQAISDPPVIAQAAPVPEGYALVPLIPTAAMIEAGCENNPTQWNNRTDPRFTADVANDVYVSMVRVAALPSGGGLLHTSSRPNRKLNP